MANPIFHRGHYNVLAACIRRELMPRGFELEATRVERNMMIEFAINLAKRLQEDNELFDPIIFLDACSPDAYDLPLSELWKND